MLIEMPPLQPPAGATGTPPAVELSECAADDLPGGRLTTISEPVGLINRLKDDPTGKLFVSVITGPPTPYGVEWSPAGAANPQNPNELWPSVMLSCGAPGDPALNPATMDLASDGTQGEPAPRLARFAQSFAHGANSSICSPSYGSAMAAIAQGLGTVTRGLTCIGAAAPLSARGQPDCAVVETYLDPMKTLLQVPIPLCAADLNMDIQAPCWRTAYDPTLCPAGGNAIEVIPDPSLQDAVGLVYDVSCAVCESTNTTAGCP